MFDIYKVQSEILKGLVKRSKGFKFAFGEYDAENVWATYDGYVAFVIPMDRWFINPIGHEKNTYITEKIFEMVNEAEVAYHTGETKQLENKVTAVRYSSKRHIAWFNEKLLARFGNGVEVRICGSTATAYIYENGKLLGAICPIMIMEGNNDD